MSDRSSRMRTLTADLAWASGYARLREWRRRGRSAILHIRHVGPKLQGGFRPQRAARIAPERLDRIIRALKRWSVEIVSLDEAVARLANPTAGRFVCLTFTGIDRGLADAALPVLTQHAVPFAVYVPTAFPDGLAAPWWLALEQVIARQDRLSLMMAGREQRFDCPDHGRKLQLYDLLYGWMRGLPPDDLAAAIGDLCGRYSVDRDLILRNDVITWDEIGRIAATPRATIGCATVNHAALTTLTPTNALREIAMGRAVLKAALGHDIRHAAFPFGDAASFDVGHVEMMRNAGFASAVTTIPGTLGRAPDLHALPRIAIDSGTTLRRLRAVLAGAVQA